MTDLFNQRPRVTLKLATSLDGRIATVSGHSQWITGPQARARVHQMRAEHDCVLTGIGTVLADDPELTARSIPMPSYQPLRAVLDTSARTPPKSKLLTSLDRGPVCLFHGSKSGKVQDGLHRIKVPISANQTGLNLASVIEALQDDFGVASIMVEAGARVAGSFLRAGLVDKIVWFRAPIIIGGDGLPVFAALAVEDLSQALVFDCLSINKCGSDVVETYAVKQSV
jgi:diaminohydroxyphosphoribosylaminopyrimidine deaminase / 5-amino-6-(5-phosphoribosylamino)uracil reductase